MTPAEIRERIAWHRAQIRELEQHLTPERDDRHFDGATFQHPLDSRRLSKQFERVRDLMADGRWRTLGEIADTLALPEASVSARLRDLRKPQFGGFLVENERVAGGLWRYRVTDPRCQDVLERVAPVVSDGPSWSASPPQVGLDVGGTVGGSSETTAQPRLAIFGWDE